MNKLFVFTGESGSGKTTLIAELTRRYPDQFKKVVTCTNRPMRISEANEVDYHFLPTEYFIGNSSLVLTKKTDEGFYYGTRKSDLFSNTHHLLLTSKLTGIGKLVDLGIKNIIVIRISISNKLKIERMQQRGDSEEMISARLRVDAGAMSKFDLGQIQVIELDASQAIVDKIQCVYQAR